MPGVAAPDLPGVTRPHLCRCDETKPAHPDQRSAAGLAHSPCSQSHARPARRVATAAGGLLPHRFAPYRRSRGAPAGMLSVAVVVRTRLSPACPHLLFREATLPHRSGAGSREVPLGNWSRKADRCPAAAHPSAQGRLYHETQIPSNADQSGAFMLRQTSELSEKLRGLFLDAFATSDVFSPGSASS